MRRRNFFATTIAALSLVALPSAAGASGFIAERLEGSNTIIVRGGADEIAQLGFACQDAYWPPSLYGGWRCHPPTVERTMRIVEENQRSGRMYFNANCSIERQLLKSHGIRVA